MPDEIKYKIVQQRNTGDKRIFRVQWRDPTTGKYQSRWDYLMQVSKEMLDRWEKNHGKTGKTLHEYRKKKNISTTYYLRLLHHVGGRRLG